MKFWPLFPRLLALLAVVSLLTAPTVTPSAAVALVTNAGTTMADMASMPDGMANCPDQKQSTPDCQKSCPLATLCFAKCAPSAPIAAEITLTRLRLSELIAPGDSLGRDFPPAPPPPRPPRI
ncbi:MAG: hypothetical protein EOQ28_09840 [Mesorhizobium sp.]|nr:MAG: hypothetical protein EOQ28_09840 [Mesorhizobium sp.]